MFIKHPHDLCSVHSRAAAESNDNIGLECSHLCGAFLSAGKSRIGSNVEEYGVLNAHFVKLVSDRCSESVFIEELIGNNECSLLVHDGFQLVKCNGQAALLHINLLRRSEPKHILSPFGNGLDIQQMLYSYVFAYGVAAP
ncbi:MAG: hypothetical protein BWZ04_03267 [Firmicutes bacterium ADurb.BinA205]|nr:MAG: hypothetical protein BWZ04_03267 [Firmicutes bacterium ADurb.BinA205]